MHRKWNRLGSVAGAAAVLAATLGAGIAAESSSAGAASKTFRILYLGALSTTYQKTNAETSALMTRAAVTVLNKSGGVNGAHVVVTVVNDGGTPTTNVTKLEAALNGPNKPNVVIEADAGTEAAASLPVLTQAKVFSFNQSPTATSGTPKKFPYSFTLSPSTTNYVQSFVAYTKSKGYKTVGIVHGNDSYGTAIGAAMAKGAAAAGLKVTGNVAYKTTGLTYTATLSTLQAGKPQVLWADGYGAASGYLVQDIKKIGWTVPTLGDDSFSVSPPIVTAPPTGSLGTTILKNVQFQTVAAGVYTPPSKTPKNRQTMLNAMKRNGHPKASLLFGYEYDGVLMAGYAARAAHTMTTAAKLAKEVVAQQKSKAVPTGLFGSYGYTATSHFSKVPVATFTFVKPTKLITGQFGAPGSAG